MRNGIRYDLVAVALLRSRTCTGGTVHQWQAAVANRLRHRGVHRLLAGGDACNEESALLDARRRHRADHGCRVLRAATPKQHPWTRVKK